MPRRPRIHLDAVPLHIVQRGHNRSACFFTDQDRQSYLNWLHEALQREHCQLHAYVLMTNHVHLLITPQQAASVSRVIISVGRRYVQAINRAYGRTGTLWDSRYKSSLVQTQRYLLLCQRYIELNPVRAGLVSDPGDYPWSSYRANALGQANGLLTEHPEYLALATDAETRRRQYRGLFSSAMDAEPIADLRLALQQNQPIGDSRFYAEIEALTGQRRELKKRGRPRQRDTAASEALADGKAQQRLPL